MSFSEFLYKVKKVNTKRVTKVSNSIGTKDIYRYIRRHKLFSSDQAVLEYRFYKIIRAINKEISNQVLKGRYIELPFNMGTIELRQYPVNYCFKNGKVRTNLPVDWNKTLKLWYEDKESYKNKTLVKMEKKTLFKIYHNKEKCRVPNYYFYTFNINRNIIKRLGTLSDEGLVQAYSF